MDTSSETSNAALRAYIPIDRQHALASNRPLPAQTQGAALFADISGFTPLAEALIGQLGPQRGPEELTNYLNLVYDALIAEVHRYHGSVIFFSGDAITCWFDGADATDKATTAAIACALQIQTAMQQFTAVPIPAGGTVALSVKVAIATGSVRRFLVGNPNVQLIDVLAGRTLLNLAEAEHVCEKGEVVLDPAAVEAAAHFVEISSGRTDAATGKRFAVVARLVEPIAPNPWPPVEAALPEDQMRPWLLAPVYERLRAGNGEFLAELRPAVAVFTRFDGIDYEGDPEAATKLDTYIQRVQTILTRYGGTLIQVTLGDKGSYLYAAFGAPIAHEDDPARAALAALEIRAIDLPFIQAAQLGISQGQMRSGAYGSVSIDADRRTYGVLGDEVNLAARLMQAAAAGQIFTTARIRQAAGNAFNWQALPAIQVKGKTKPIALHVLLGTNTRPGMRLLEPRYALPMVGRETELAQIVQRLDEATHGRGQIVAVTGEAGMGKSRLVAEVIGEARRRGADIFAGEGQSYGTNTSYLAWRSVWRGLFDVDADAPVEAHVEALTAQLAQVDPALVSRLPLLGALLNLPIPDNDLTRSMDAKLRKASLEALLVDWLRGRSRDSSRARSTPLVLVLEDCHWLDPLSQDLLETLGPAIADLPVMLVLAYRPPEPGRQQAPRVTTLGYFLEVRLTELSAPEMERLIQVKLAQLYQRTQPPPAALVQSLMTRSQGNPFYLEELLNYLRDRAVDPYQPDALDAINLPTSLQSLILSRIDQLTEKQKTMVKMASVIGRLFRAAMLWGAFPALGSPETLRDDLDALVHLDLTPLDTPDPELAYLFKHIVTQEVAYESLPFATRGILHNQIGEHIEQRFADAVDQWVDLLAFHFDRSPNEPKRRTYLTQAGDAARVNYANAAAIDYYRRLLPLLSGASQIETQLKLGQVLELVGAWAEAEALYQQALALADELGNALARAQSRAQSETALGDLLRRQGQFAEAATRLEAARAAFESLGDQAGMGRVLHFVGTLAAQQGELETARGHYEASLALRRALQDQPQTGSLLSNLGIVESYLGNFARAQAYYEESLVIRRATGDRWAISVSLNNLGNLALLQEDHATARNYIEQAVALNREVGDRSAIAISLNNLGNTVRALGDYAAAQAMYAEALQINRVLGDKRAMTYLLEDLGCLAVLEGEPARGLTLVAAASALRESIGAPLSEPEQAKLDENLAPARAALDAEAQQAATNAGMALPLAQAIELALSNS